MENEPCNLLIQKLKKHNTIMMCPYCKQLFDIHTGMIFLEGKDTKDVNKLGHDYFVKVMSDVSK